MIFQFHELYLLFIINCLIMFFYYYSNFEILDKIIQSEITIIFN
jgi:hypothetical protein